MYLKARAPSLANSVIYKLAEPPQWLSENSGQLAALLDAVWPELERAIDTSLEQLWGSSTVGCGLADLLHHHGQITNIQSLLGDAENYINVGALVQHFRKPQG